MKRILIMMDSLTCGGAEKSLISLLPFLVKREYRITLMLMHRGGLFERYVPKEVEIVDFPYSVPLFCRLFYSLSLRMPWNRNRHAAEIYWKSIGSHYLSLDDEFDVAIAYQQGFPTFYIAEKVRAKRKFCWVNVDMDSAGYSPKFCRSFYECYDRVVAVSDTLSKMIVTGEYCGERSKIMVCLDILNEQLIKEMSNEFCAFDKTDNTLHITTVGRLVPPKGYDIAIEAAKLLRERGVDFVWHIVGGGGLMAEIERGIAGAELESKVVLEGEQLNPYPYMAACDIYVQTSKFEGFGLTVGEAKILGKPIVSTNFPVIYNQIKDGENGLVVEMNGCAVADGILRLVNDSSLKDKLVGNVCKEHNVTAETESAKVINLIEEKC